MNVALMPDFFFKAISFFRDPTVSIWKKLIGVAAIAYVLLPFDAVPDFIPLFGWLDDLGVLSIAAMYVVREIRKHTPLPPRER